MPTVKTGTISVKTSGEKVSVEVVVPTGTKLKDALKVIDIAKVAAIRKFQPGGCTQCTSGRDFRLRELERVLPAKLSPNMAAFDLKTGKLIG
jgi:hypothetical protein